jgi:hypothetical protein
MTNLASFDSVKLSLRFDGTDHADNLIAHKLEEASAIVMDYLKLQEAPEAWGGEVPGPVRSATILVTRNLVNGTDPIDEPVRSLLERQRDPAFV